MSKLSFAGGDKTVYWYIDGQKQEWQLDKSKAILKLQGQLPANTLPTSAVLKTSEVDQQATQGFIKLEFNEANDEASRQDYLTNLRYAYPSGSLWLTIQKPGDAKPMRINEKMFVAFNSYMSNEDIYAFGDKYGLEWTNPAPQGLPGGWKYVCIFRQKNFSIENNTAVLSARIVEQEGAKVSFANPNIVALPEEGFAPDGEASNDAEIEKAWFIDNHGQRITCSPNGGTEGADAHVNEVWDMGYTGAGIRVGVVDFGGFDYNHPDMIGRILPGWDCVSNQQYNTSNAAVNPQFGGHGMAVAGIIAANGNNGVGSSGIAYNAWIIPFYVNGESDEQLVIAMQKAIEFDYNVDIMNFSLGINHPSDAVRQQIENLANAGRTRYGIVKGVVMVASHGNTGQYDGDAPQWPAAYPQVISVGSTTPDDMAKVTGDDWNLSNTAWATNYGDQMDVVAPGVCIYTTDMAGANGYGANDYTNLGKTSASAPIVTGVAALLLEKNAALTWEEVREILTGNADKVHPEIYDYNYDSELPGRSMQTGYGRINAARALNVTSVGITENTDLGTRATFSVTSPVDKEVLIRYNLGGEPKEVSLAIYDMSGKLLHSRVLGVHEEQLTINVADYSPGMYFARFMNKEDEMMQTVKFIKLW